MRKNILMGIALLITVVIVGCAGATGDIKADDPIVRGCSYIACAIVTHAVLQAIFNK